MPRLIEWDTLDVRVDGEKLNALLAAFRVEPIERLHVRLMNGLMRIEGSVRKFVSVPFAIEVTELRAAGTEVRVPVHSATAFGAIPVPRFLFALVREKLPRDLVRYEEPATFVVSLDRILPQFVSAEIQKIWIIDGGLSVTLGKGGADLPPGVQAPGLTI
jgi:hypothetical protein